jgi:hypothetical protein
VGLGANRVRIVDMAAQHNASNPKESGVSAVAKRWPSGHVSATWLHASRPRPRANRPICLRFLELNRLASHATIGPGGHKPTARARR